MKPTIGRIVYYKLSLSDIEEIEDLELDGRLSPLEEGQNVPAMIVSVSGEDERCNLRLHLDGAVPSPWVKWRSNGDEPGQWSWPPRV